MQALLSAASATSALDLRTAAVRALGTTAWPEGADALRTALASASTPGHGDLGVHARCSLLQVAPTPEIFDALLTQLEQLETGKGAAELAFGSVLKRRAQQADVDPAATKDLNHWNQLGSKFGARPSVAGLTKRRQSRAAWLREHRDRLLAVAIELAGTR